LNNLPLAGQAVWAVSEYETAVPVARP